MVFKIKVYHSVQKLPLTVKRMKMFAILGQLYWERDGETREVPIYVLRDCIRQNDTLIEWSQCEPLPEKPLPVTLNPRPARS